MQRPMRCVCRLHGTAAVAALGADEQGLGGSSVRIRGRGCDVGSINVAHARRGQRAWLLRSRVGHLIGLTKIRGLRVDGQVIDVVSVDEVVCVLRPQ